VSQLLEILGRSLDHELSDVLDRHFRTAPSRGLDELRRQAAEHPDWPDVQLSLGLTLMRAMQTAEAIEHLALACRQKPDMLAARLALACALDEHGSHDAVMEQLALANTTHPGDTAVLFAMGFTRERLAQPKKAAECYRDAIERDAAFLPARERLAAVSVLLGETGEAIAQYEVLRQVKPDKSWVRTALAHLYYRDGQYDQAVAHFETAVAMEPANWALLDDEVEALVASGQLREAIERLHTLIDEQGAFPDLHVRLADLYSQTGDDEGATRHYIKALDLQNDYLEAHVKLGTHHLINGRWEEAAESFHAGLELNDRLVGNYVGLGVSHLRAGRRAEAMKNFDLAAAVEPNSTLLLSEMARLQLKSALAEDYLAAFESDAAPPIAEVDLDNDHLLARQLSRHEEEIARHPGHADMRYRYGVLLRSQGELIGAMEQFEKAIELNPGYSQAIIKLGLTQQELGRLDEAVETFARALELRPQYVDLHYRLGLLYTDRREFDKAVQHMEQAAEGAPDNQQIRASLALSLQNMGLMDRAAATWRSLWRLHHAPQK
jgi:tetratricopeptide (TPR) repeat protein